MKIGAHLSIVGGIDKAIRKTAEKNLSALQLFTGSPRAWILPPISEQTINKFRKLANSKNIKDIFIHSKYLVNVASSDPKITKKSVASIVFDLQIAAKIKAKGVIFHSKLTNFNLLIENLILILHKSPLDTLLILENSAQMDLIELGKVFKTIKNPRLKFCLDTAHAFEAGYDLKKITEIIDKNIGLDNLVVIHLNNSKTKFNSKHDVHADIIKGEIDQQTFAEIINHQKLKNLPFILEIPSLKEKEWQEIQKNINFLKKLLF